MGGEAGPGERTAGGGEPSSRPVEAVMPLRWRLAGYGACAAATYAFVATHRLFDWPLRVPMGDWADFWLRNMYPDFFRPGAFLCHVIFLAGFCFLGKTLVGRIRFPRARRTGLALLILLAAGLEAWGLRAIPLFGSSDLPIPFIGKGLEESSAWWPLFLMPFLLFLATFVLMARVWGLLRFRARPAFLAIGALLTTALVDVSLLVLYPAVKSEVRYASVVLDSGPVRIDVYRWAFHTTRYRWGQGAYGFSLQIGSRGREEIVARVNRFEGGEAVIVRIPRAEMDGHLRWLKRQGFFGMPRFALPEMLVGGVADGYFQRMTVTNADSSVSVTSYSGEDEAYDAIVRELLRRVGLEPRNL